MGFDEMFYNSSYKHQQNIKKVHLYLQICITKYTVRNCIFITHYQRQFKMLFIKYETHKSNFLFGATQMHFTLHAVHEDFAAATRKFTGSSFYSKKLENVRFYLSKCLLVG